MNKKKSILIGEDQILIAEHLLDIVSDFGYNVVGIFHNKNDIIKGLKKHQPDIALLDIKMETKFTGVEIGEYIINNFDIPFIYITAHSEKQTLQKALKTKPSAYILKPFKAKEIQIAIELAFEKHISRTKDCYLNIKDGSINVKILFSEIMFLKSDDNYVEIHTKKRKYITRNTLKNISKELDENLFVKTHRSFIINKNFAIKYSSKQVFVDDIKIPVSRKYIEDVKTIFK